MKQSYIFLANGFEEIEALTVVDVFRRASLPIITVSIESDLTVVGAHGIPVRADKHFAEQNFGDAQWLILPGGMPGATNLAKFAPLSAALQAQATRKGHIAAICAAPAVVLAPLGILDNRQATCYPGFESQFPPSVRHRDHPVVIDANIITANGPATALPFALAIVGATAGEAKAQEVGSGMLFYPPKKSQFYF